METQAKEKFCVDCGCNRPVTEFYKTRKWLQKLCKFHHNKKRHKNYVPRKKGFDKLDDETKIKIKEDAKKMSMKKLSTLYDIKYYSIRKWRKEGHI